LGIEDRDWYRDEIRKREAWPHPLSSRPRSSWSERDSSPLWIATWCVLFAAAADGSFAVHGWWKEHHQPDVVVQQAPPPQPADPFKDDPTWHTGPRPAAELPDSTVTIETREVTKCVVNGRVSYGAQGDCRGGSKVAVPIAGGPTYEQQQEAQTRADALAEQAADVDRRLAWDEWRRSQVTVSAAPSNLARNSECAALDEAIRGYDAQARQPQPSGMQDWIKDQRANARSRQFALHC
jgi:hypothetical protein